MIARQYYRVRVEFRRDPVGEVPAETRVLDVSACDQMQALDLAIGVARRQFGLTPYDEVSATPFTDYGFGPSFDARVDAP